MAGSLSTALLTGTAAGVVALLTLGLARAARRCGLPRLLAPAAVATAPPDRPGDAGPARPESGIPAAPRGDPAQSLIARSVI
jgi:hypothetical protein